MATQTTTTVQADKQQDQVNLFKEAERNNPTSNFKAYMAKEQEDDAKKDLKKKKEDGKSGGGSSASHAKAEKKLYEAFTMNFYTATKAIMGKIGKGPDSAWN